MKEYLNLLQDVLDNGTPRLDRTGPGTVGVFGRQIRCNLNDGFPLLTTKKLYTRAITAELLWFLRGDTNIQYLHDNNVTIWDEWADENGDLGPVYGAQWRKWKTEQGAEIDQIGNLIKSLKENPYSRRHIVSAWNVAQVDHMALPPCHTLFQLYVAPPAQEGDKPRLSLQLYQRSADLFLGVPFNIASYSLLLMILAKECDYEPYEYIHTFGDLHLYSNHLEQARLQLTREPKQLPKLTIVPDKKNIDEYEINDFILEGYDPYPTIKADVSV